MNTRIIPALLGALLFSGVAEAAPSIYPVDTARFLGGSRFDFKVEFDGELAEKDAKVLINGQDAKAVLGAKPEFIAKEKGADASALLLRGASLKPGQYKVTVESPTGKASANWDVYGTPDKPVAKNVILLVADGLSVGHRTAARLLSEGMTNGKYNGSCHGHPAPHRHARHGQRGRHHRRLRQHHLRLHHRAQVQHERPRRIRGPYRRLVGRSQTGNPRRTAASHDRQGHRRRVDAEIEDATPAAVSVTPDAVTTRRNRRHVPRVSPTCSRRRCGLLPAPDRARFQAQGRQELVETFRTDGTPSSTSNTELAKAVTADPRKLLGLFHPVNMDGVLDRRFLKKGTVYKFPDQPDLTDSMGARPCSVLSETPKAFS